MIQLTRSRHLKTLAQSLAEKLVDTAPDDPFVSQKVMVPNLDTARWFKLFAAQQNGIAANLECILPAEWFWRQIRKIYPDLPDLLPSDLQPMKWALFELLSDVHSRTKFEILDRYIKSQPEERKTQATFQLAGQIASVFDEYLVYRPEMILRWQRGRSGKADEKWQSELWRLLNDFWKKSGDGDLKNRAELYEEVMRAFSKKELDVDDSLYILNPGLLPLPIVNMLKKTGEQSEVFVYQISVSKEIRKNSNEIFQVFGRESTNEDQVINILDPNEVLELHSEIPDDSILQQIQSDIFQGNSIRKFSENESEIGGIEIRSCHSSLREIEVLHQFLLEKFEENETLHPDDVLVVTPDLETYKPYIKAVFDQAEAGLPQIPYHAGYSSRNSEAGIERTLLRLLSLVDSRFEFSDVIDLFMMKPVYQSFGISESDGNKLKRWIEENHVVWGLDARHRKEFDQPAEELQTWDSAIRRGWYGNLLGGKSGDSVNDLLLYQGIRTTNDQETWAAFSNYLSQLNNMRQEIKRKKRCSKWAEWLSSRMDSLFDAASLGSLEAQGIKRMIGQISEQSEIAGCEQEIPFSLFRSELSSMLDRHKASGALFTNGATFSSMVPVRSIPFKIIALIGLNESTFPRKQITPDFDLMAQNPLPGERNRKNEDRNLFLESVMAAGDVHYCSYIGQSQVDNEVIPPSTIVGEWVDVLSKTSGMDSKKIIKKEALSGFSPANFKSKKSFSGIYFQTARYMLDDEESVSGLKLSEPIPLEEAEETIQLDDLIRFYSNPIQWFFRKRLEVSLREANHGKDEFELDHLEKHILFQRVFGWVLDGMDDQKIQKYLVQSGAIPVGWSGERRVLELKRNVRSAIAVMKDSGIHPKPGHYQIHVAAGQSQVEGSLMSYSDDQFVDINPSKFSGKIAIDSWIRHLCGSLAESFEERKSILFCELKDGDSKKIVFKPVPKPDAILSGLINFYHEGLIRPQTFFPKTLYAFEERKRGEKLDAYYKAANAFNTDDYSFGENNDLSIKTLLGENVEFQEKFITERYRRFIQQMMDHMEES
ncbi:exodeoxyribonuclease V subunit gamma [Rhodohalobacter sp. 614A]|uniref:exodeoxyribonuclease V subunit gamma n=1 Tax=Rhodohalobacter sp. 614A TaxID=2908649 RepID=UPI001F480CB5|nr:exodeoxyribonuclease V subunit gamma [Rhodohalobacter sp. 614A]